MKIKVSDYIAEKLVQAGIKHVFTVTGGGAMHLNDSLGHQQGLCCMYNHHEQACAMAAEAYARIQGRIAALCVTTGPGGTNAITGVVGGWLDSIPMLVLSGQVRYDTTARSTGLGIRAMGDQEFEITKAIDCMTKYSEMITQPMRIRYCLEKALYLAYSGRPGPVWLDIPLDIQGAYIEAAELTGFDPEDYEAGGTGWAGQCTDWAIAEDVAGKGERRQKLPEKVSRETVNTVISKIRQAKRPVFYAGNGIRIAGAHEVFLQVAEQLGIPVVTGWNSQDAIWGEHPLHVGQAGGMGDRPGNFAVQNSDLVFAVGSRLSIRQVGYNYETWAREAYVIVNDVDKEELQKPSVHADMRIHADALDLLTVMAETLGSKYSLANPLFDGGQGLPGKTWSETCSLWKKRYPVILPKHLENDDLKAANVYALVEALSSRLAEGQVTVVGNGSACVVGGHAYHIKKNQRFITNSAIASMGYDLPAAIGVCAAVEAESPGAVIEKRAAVGAESPGAVIEKRAAVGAESPGAVIDERAAVEAESPGAVIDEREAVGAKLPAAGMEPISENLPEPGTGHRAAARRQDIILLTGDGSIQMNLQELQTIIHHKLPVKIFLINNGGYHSIRQTQKNFFGEPLVGIGADSYDLSFPDMKKLAAAYGYPYTSARHNSELGSAVEAALNIQGPVICEVFVTIDQNFEPKSSAKRLADGTLISPPLEDLSPFLPDEEMDEMMVIPRLKGNEA